MAVSIDDPHSYEWLCLCIQEFEQAALQSNTRAGILAVANGATYAIDIPLDAQEQSLNRVASTRQALHPTGEESGAPGQANIDLISGDTDLQEMFGNSNSAFANYLEDCIGCSLRLKFDWQLKPLNLLGPIDDFLSSIDAALDRLAARIDPFKILEDICWALNHMKTLCPQDLILILLALKMLLKKYLLQMFSIKLDWTTLLGPILKAILSAITDLLDNLFQLLMAPIDCALSGMRATNDLLRQTESFLNQVCGSATQTANTLDSLASGQPLANANPIFKDVSWTDPDPAMKADPLAFFNGSSGTNQGYDPGKLSVTSSLGQTPTPEDALRVPVGFQLTSNTNTFDALQDPGFPNSTWLEKLIIPVQEARAWLQETYEKFIGSLNSLNSLVGGSIGFSLDNAGVMLFILDMVSLVKLIISLLKSNVNVTDWCSFIQSNPQVLEEPLRSQFGNVNVDARGTGVDSELVIRQGPQLVGTVKTCVNSRTVSDNRAVSDWIRMLEARGAV